MTPEIQNIEAEQALLGAVLLNNDVMARAGGIVRDADFADPVHAEIWAACASRIAADQLASPTTLALAFEGHPGLAQLGGPAYLVRLAGAAVSIFAAKDYAQIVARCARKRRLAETLAAAAARLHDDDADVDVALGMVEAQSLAEETRGSGKIVSFKEVLAAAVNAANEADLRDGVAGVTTGIADLDHATGGWMPGELVILAGRPAMGKQQPVDRPVLTPEGWQPIGSIRVGDAVIGVAGKPLRVTAIHPQGVQQAYRVTFRDGTSTECGIDHLWTVAPSGGNGRSKFRTMTLRDLMEKGIRAPKPGRVGAKWRIPIAAPAEFAPVDLPVPPYLLGVLIGDGATAGRDLRFSNPDMDCDIRDRVTADLPPDISLTENRSGSCPYFNLVGPGRAELRARLNALGLYVLSKNKEVPQVYLRASPDQRLALLRGLMDTDGGVMGGSSSFFTTSRSLALGVAELVRSLAGQAKVRTYDRSKEEKPVEYVVSVIMSKCPFLTSRKAAKWRPGRPARYIVSAEPSRIVEQVCITVEAKDGLYLTDDFIVTHNSAVALNMALSAARAGHGVAMCSLEMTPAEIGIRALATEATRAGSPFAYQDARRGTLRDGGVAQITQVARAVQGLPIEMTPPDARDIAGIYSAIKRIKARYEAEGGSLDLVVIDYLQLIQPASQRRSGSRQEDVSEISAALKGMAMRLGVPILALSQLSRAVESRDDKRPVLGDLRESGAIEQDANTVIMVFREEYYLRREEPHPHESADEHADWHAALQRCAGLVDLIVSKQRMGDTPTIRARFDAPTNTIADLGRPL